MKTLSTFALLGVAALSLAACGSSGTSDLAQFDDEQALFDAIDNGELAEVDTSTRTGTATLNGAVGVDVSNEEQEVEVVGNLTITADFDADTATGTASDFGAYDGDGNLLDGGDLGGSMDVTNGAISGTDFTADLDGTLVSEGDDFTFDLTMDGGFYDNDGDLAVAGEVTGTMLDVVEDVTDDVDGGFVATE